MQGLSTQNLHLCKGGGVGKIWGQFCEHTKCVEEQKGRGCEL